MDNWTYVLPEELQTDEIKKHIVPTLTEKQIKFVYANEADVINVANKYFSKPYIMVVVE